MINAHGLASPEHLRKAFVHSALRSWQVLSAISSKVDSRAWHWQLDDFLNTLDVHEVLEDCEAGHGRHQKTKLHRRWTGLQERVTQQR